MERKEFYSILFDEKTENIPPSNLSNFIQILRSLPVNFYDDEGEDFEFFVPFYAEDSFHHLNSTDVFLLFLMFGYDIIKEFKILDGGRFEVILANDIGEIIYQYTEPEKFGIYLDLIISNKRKSVYLEIDGYSTKVFYKTRGMRRPKLLELEEISDIFVDWVTEYLEIESRDYKYMYF
jgi:hypothetical protein